MDFLAPLALGLLLLLPVLAALHVFGLPFRTRTSVRLSSLALLSAARSRRPWRRHVIASLFLLGLASLSIGAARPVAEMQVPAKDVSVVLALDISGSMAADDISPTRLEAARAAALRFLDGTPPGTRVGLVVFNQQARLLAAPTAEHQTLRVVLGSLEAQGATAMGDAVLQSLIAVRDPVDVQSALLRAVHGADPDPAPNGKVGVVVLTDGESNAGEDVRLAGTVASLLGVKVYTIGLGTDRGLVQSTNGDPVTVGFNEDALRELARRTGATYFLAPSRQELERVFSELAGSITWKKEKLELSFVACALAAPLLLLGLVLSQRWTQRFP